MKKWHCAICRVFFSCRIIFRVARISAGNLSADAVRSAGTLDRSQISCNLLSDPPSDVVSAVDVALIRHMDIGHNLSSSLLPLQL